MTDAIEAIASKLIEAAYERFGMPPDPGGIYIATATQEVDVPAYFREVVALAREPRSRELFDRCQELFDTDAAMVMEAGLKRLSQDHELPPAERRVIEEIEAAASRAGSARWQTRSA
ncbi:hypothetical protein [Mesorhizobium sp.]|uniref:hypothetical protein n=1 Tax=Mesorhizobium sp. TaxID=1871066 RepID=UPI000FE62597|nr:hypothetical protein [Mesorhizobium sp.]RWK53153.1 MAG: hypothetical protein EOR48_22600 [Mesorhizobium sp.]TIP43532.1 MAG: hypothetical protein E5X62_18400 [Mesorhizobium sp.]